MGGKSVLMVGFHFPPCALSSGHLRLLGFAKYLPEFGWDPIILSASKWAYQKVDPSSISSIPDGTRVCRAFALDTRRHLGIRGKYPSILAQPDRWISWWPAAVLAGLRLIRRYSVRAVWSTYPIMTAHCIAYALNRATGIPWVADYRDPVVTSVAGKSRMTVRTQMRWEQRVVSRATCSVFAAPGAMQAYAERYPSIPSRERMTVIANGFDEDDFVNLPYRYPSGGSGPLHFVHAGMLYPHGRNPVPFFEAIARLKRTGRLADADIRITLRACGSEKLYADELKRWGLADIVTLAPSLPYRRALAEQAQADGLLLFQGQPYDRQIPAKLYEYLRLGKPIFALVGEQGDTGALLKGNGNAVVVPIDAVSEIERAFLKFMRDVREGAFAGVGPLEIERYTRAHAAKELAELLERISPAALDD